MKMLINFKVIYLIFLVICFSSGFSIFENKCRSQDKEITDAITKIKNALLLLQQNEESIIIDVILGCSYTKANILWSIDKLKYVKKQETNNLITKLKDVLKVIDTINDKYYAENPVIKVAHESLWVGTVKEIKHGRLKGEMEYPVIPDGKNCTEVQQYLMNGSPYYSDYCIFELIESCNVKDYCWDSETNPWPHSGYKTTHRLFYLLIATRLQCDKKNPERFSTAEKMIEELCWKIYLEAEEIAKKNYPNKLRDVFIEQIAFCGLEGFAEYAKPEWREAVRSWEDEKGCYDSYNLYECAHERFLTLPPNFKEVYEFPYSGKLRRKRSDTLLKNGCHSHIIAVTLATLSFHLRYSINECIENIG